MDFFRLFPILSAAAFICSSAAFSSELQWGKSKKFHVGPGQLLEVSFDAQVKLCGDPNCPNYALDEKHRQISFKKRTSPRKNPKHIEISFGDNENCAHERMGSSSENATKKYRKESTYVFHYLTHQRNWLRFEIKEDTKFLTRKGSTDAVERNPKFETSPEIEKEARTVDLGYPGKTLKIGHVETNRGSFTATEMNEESLAVLIPDPIKRAAFLAKVGQK